MVRSCSSMWAGMHSCSPCLVTLRTRARNESYVVHGRVSGEFAPSNSRQCNLRQPTTSHHYSIWMQIQHYLRLNIGGHNILKMAYIHDFLYYANHADELTGIRVADRNYSSGRKREREGHGLG